MKRIFALIALLVLASCLHQAAAPSAGSVNDAVVEGRIVELGTGKAVEGAFVYAYRETNTHFFGPPNHLSQQSSADGAFRLELPAGNYYLFARKRASGSYQGPLLKDDWFSEKDLKLVAVGRGANRIELSVQKLEGQQFYRPEKFFTKTDTLISGRIVDASGKPVMGAFAFAYRDKFVKREPPQYGSTASDADGRYYLYLDRGGQFVVGARMQAKEPPAQGELVGFYRNDRGAVLSVPSGNGQDGVDITIVPFVGSPEVQPANIPLQR